MRYQRDEIEALVRQVVNRTLGESGSPVTRPLLDEESMRRMPTGSSQQVAAGTLITPLARQIALEKRIRLVETQEAGGEGQGTGGRAQVARGRWQAAGEGAKIVALGADHGGYPLKEQLKHFVAGAGYQVIDCGTNSTAAVDYPDFAYAVARLVADGRAWRGLIIDGAGIGSCMTANKVPGVRAAMCYDQATAVNSREHNNANVLTLGAGLIGPNLAQQIVATWLATEFAGGRHAKRVGKIDALDERFKR
jgi:ribose 5-phosphate isomerase B